MGCNLKRFSLSHHLQNEMCRKSGSNQRIIKVSDCPTTGLCALTRGHLAPLYSPRSTCLPDKLDCRYLLLSGTVKRLYGQPPITSYRICNGCTGVTEKRGIVHVKQKTEVGGVRVPVIPIKKKCVCPRASDVLKTIRMRH